MRCSTTNSNSGSALSKNNRYNYADPNDYNSKKRRPSLGAITQKGRRANHCPAQAGRPPEAASSRPIFKQILPQPGRHTATGMGISPGARSPAQAHPPRYITAIAHNERGQRERDGRLSLETAPNSRVYTPDLTNQPRSAYLKMRAPRQPSLTRYALGYE